MSRQLDSLLVVAAELRAAGRTWNYIAQQVHRKAATVQEWPRKHKAD